MSSYFSCNFKVSTNRFFRKIGQLLDVVMSFTTGSNVDRIRQVLLWVHSGIILVSLWCLTDLFHSDNVVPGVGWTMICAQL